jgi:hypothetical protein
MCKLSDRSVDTDAQLRKDEPRQSIIEIIEAMRNSRVQAEARVPVDSTELKQRVRVTP